MPIYQVKKQKSYAQSKPEENPRKKVDNETIKLKTFQGL